MLRLFLVYSPCVIGFTTCARDIVSKAEIPNAIKKLWRNIPRFLTCSPERRTARRSFAIALLVVTASWYVCMCAFESVKLLKVDGMARQVW
jgi:hypothetical protein